MLKRFERFIQFQPQLQGVKVGTSQGNLLIVVPGTLKSSDVELLNNWLHVRCPNDSIQMIF